MLDATNRLNLHHPNQMSCHIIVLNIFVLEKIRNHLHPKIGVWTNFGFGIRYVSTKWLGESFKLESIKTYTLVYNYSLTPETMAFRTRTHKRKLVAFSYVNKQSKSDWILEGNHHMHVISLDTKRTS